MDEVKYLKTFCEHIQEMKLTWNCDQQQASPFQNTFNHGELEKAISSLLQRLASAEGRVKELGISLGKVLMKDGVLNGLPCTGPELLFAAQNYLTPTEPNADKPKCICSKEYFSSKCPVHGPIYFGTEHRFPRCNVKGCKDEECLVHSTGSKQT